MSLADPTIENLLKKLLQQPQSVSEYNNPVFTFNITQSGLSGEQFQALMAKLDTIQKLEQQIMATEQQVADALAKIDAATTGIATNLQATVTLTGQISDEVDALVKAAQSAGVSQALVDQAVAIGAKADTVNSALAAQVPVLQAIAAKGVTNPVPTPVPAPTPVGP